MLPTGSGASLVSVVSGSISTSKLCFAVRPPRSRAVTVTVAVPSATPVSRTGLPLAFTVSFPVADDTEVNVNRSPSSSSVK